MIRRKAAALLMFSSFLAACSGAQDASDGAAPTEEGSEETVGTLSSELPAGIPEYTTDASKCFLKGELDREAARLQRIPVPGCASPIVVPVRTITACGPYKPGEYTHFNCEWVRRDKFAQLPITTGFQEFIDLADRAANANEDSADVACLAGTIGRWAYVGALSVNDPTVTGDFRIQADHVRAWKMGAFATVYLKMAPVRKKAISLGFGPTIQQWFSAQGLKIADFVDDHPEHGNLLYWKGFALGALGFASQNPAFVWKSFTAFEAALGDIQDSASDPRDRGWLPQELTRENKAQQYHAYALLPILGMHALSNAAGCTFFDRTSTPGANRLAMAALIRKTIEGSYRPEVFTAKTGTAQTGVTPVEGYLGLLGTGTGAKRMMNDVESYLATYPNPKITLGPLKPARVDTVGGRLDNFPRSGSIAVTDPYLRAFCR